HEFRNGFSYVVTLLRTDVIAADNSLDFLATNWRGAIFHGIVNHRRLLSRWRQTNYGHSIRDLNRRAQCVGETVHLEQRDTACGIRLTHDLIDPRFTQVAP